VRIVEWPGWSISKVKVEAPDRIFQEVVRGTREYLPLEYQSLPLSRVFLPWGTILDLESNGKTFPVLSGPQCLTGLLILI
jgi:hypothetical protein